MFVRRRPIARAAIVGGTAYAAGRHGANNRAREEDQQAQLDELAAQNQQLQAQMAAQAAPPPPPPAPAAAPSAAGGMTQDTIDQLKQLADLHSSGVLTDEEFEAQKSKLLGG